MKGDITLRFSEKSQNWEVIFEDSENKLHSVTVQTLDGVFETILTLIKMMS